MVNVEIPKWLEGLPLAPEFRPTDTEFADPIAYISKIEKEASAFGICKVIPPLPKPSKRYVFSNLNKSLSKCPELGENADLSSSCSSLKIDVGDGANDEEFRAIFTTRQQELGQSTKRTKGMIKEKLQLGVPKQVWQSGENYTLEQFESKSKVFARSMLGMLKEVTPLVVEALFWKAASEKPIYVEYANDVPGSGFGEPEGQFRYFHRRRRKRASYQSYRNRDREDKMGTAKQSHNDEAKEASIQVDPEMPVEATPRSSITLPSFSEETFKSSKRKSVNVSNDVEGTAGWKLSNSPWNLQVIARSSGSLTRYMPDDIPGVTSPMVYIGMLFSWFAWHVEDHELHSLNFLHTGSAKTWYAVPGDYAFAFEEVIRSEAYGANIDRLAALKLLGEKTTLLSPELVVSSGIPCCRLIQNPGEFVVTFPRAYHVGFSHGFNCGEAANFGTPQWLNVAKEAAVRRAAMNYLPMLSHQQLLYLLTMSFVSRVPRSLLPGARSSRLRDRQREERELSVKKAFLDDLLKENGMLSILTGKDSTCQVVIWNPDLLPCKESQLSNLTTTHAITHRENASEVHSECNTESEKNDLYKELSLYMENLNDLYVDDDDVSCDFQVDSGTLPCVACGILGFPFMSVLQPSERLFEHLPVDDIVVQERTGVAKSENGCFPAEHESTPVDPVSVSVPSVPVQSLPPSDLPMPKGWKTSNKFMRPRIFCLEHGLQIKELLQERGGVNMLVICHSDYQKMKAHAAVIAEENGIPFNCNEVQLETASQEDLNLVYFAIDDENQHECGEDWTSKMGINMKHYVKVRKNSPSEQIHHALVLGGLFSDRSPSSDFLKWQSRRSRSRTKLNQPSHRSSCSDVETNRDEESAKNSVRTVVEKEEKLIQYTRRKFKVKTDCSTSVAQECPKMHMVAKVSVSTCENRDNHSSSDNSIDKNTRSRAAGSGNPSGTSTSQDTVFTAYVRGESTEGQIENQSREESNKREIVCAIISNSSEMLREMKAKTGCNKKGNSCATKFSHRHVRETEERFETQRKDLRLESINVMNETSDEAREGQHILANVEFPMNENSDPAKPPSVHTSCPPMGQMETNQPIVVDESSAIPRVACSTVKLCNPTTSESDMHDTVQAANETKEASTCSVTVMEIDLPSLASSKDIHELHRRTSTEEEWTCSTLDTEVLLNSPTMNERNVVESQFDSTAQQKDHAVTISAEKCSEVPIGNSTPEKDLPLGLHFDTKPQQGSRSNGDDEVQKIHQTDEEESPSSHVEDTSQPTSDQSRKCTKTEEEKGFRENMPEGNKATPPKKQEIIKSTVAVSISPSLKGRRRKNEVEQMTESNFAGKSFIRSPCEGLRPRAGKDATRSGVDTMESNEGKPAKKKARKQSDTPISHPKKKENTKRAHKCDLEGCRMSFETKAELQLHKRNRCPYEGCGKRFSSHKYAIIHQRVHEDDRPLKCPWKGCSMSFKWAWARTEHMRVHTGERPYQCKVEGCGLSFRFVSDFSRHRRKTGHMSKQLPDNSP